MAGLVRLEGRVPVWRVVDEDTCRPSFDGSHYRISCFNPLSVSTVPAPVATSACGAIAMLAHEDQYAELSCAGANFQGYFTPSRWTVTKIKGDGGVDVTGAPNSILVEGANNALVSAVPGGAMSMQILIPADGFVAFGCKHIGGSNLFPGEFRVMVNDRAQEVSRKNLSTDFYRFFVRQGDHLTLEVKAAELELEGFQLQTEAKAVVQRTWTATDDQGRSNSFTQFISIEKPNITDIIIPDAVTVSPKTDPGLLKPEVTGYPFIDRDGLPETADDRMVLRDCEDCGLKVSYQDEVQEMPGGLVILRRWTISDPCDGNYLESTQLIRLFPAASTGDETEDRLSAPTFLPVAPEMTSEHHNSQGGNDWDQMSY